MIVMILGMHRSGTSTIAGVLHLNRIIMGTYQNFWPRPLNQNPKGFYENYDFRKINDQMLKKVNYDVKSYNPEIPIPVSSTKIFSKVKKLIMHCNKFYHDWGWKDPRSCLTAHCWVEMIYDLELQNNLKIIFVARKASSVARSLKKRNGLSIEIGMELWKSYTDRALKFCENSELPIHYCSFENLLDNPIVTCNYLFEFLERPWEQSVVDKFIEKKISTSAKGEDIYYPDHINILEEKVYSLLQK